jgi:hypothetical protein
MTRIFYINNIAYRQSGNVLTAIDGKHPPRTPQNLALNKDHVAHLRLVRIDGVLMYDDERLQEYRTFGPPYQPHPYRAVNALIADGLVKLDVPTGPLLKRLIAEATPDLEPTDEPEPASWTEPF